METLRNLALAIAWNIEEAVERGGHLVKSMRCYMVEDERGHLIQIYHEEEIEALREALKQEANDSKEQKFIEEIIAVNG